MAITSEVGISIWKSFLVSFLVSGIENILDRVKKTVRIETGYSEIGGSKKRTKNHPIFFKGQKLLMPIVQIVFPWSVYLFHCITKNYAGGAN